MRVVSSYVLLLTATVPLVSALTADEQLVVDNKDIKDVNWAEVGGAAAGGFVAGATLGLAPVGASLGVAALWGGLGGAAGSQVQALTQAGIEEFLGTNPQGSFIEDAMDLGFLDPTTIMVNAGVGAAMGSLGNKFAGWLRSELPLPESASVIHSSGELPMARWQVNVDQPGTWAIQMEGRVINIDANTFQKIVRSLGMGLYDAAEQIIAEAWQQGLIEVSEESAQP